MNPSEEFEVEQSQLDPLPVNPIDSFPSQLNLPGIVDVLDNALPPAGEHGEYLFPNSIHRPLTAETAQDLEPTDGAGVFLEHQNVTATNEENLHLYQEEEIPIGNWQCDKCMTYNLGSDTNCSSCQSYRYDQETNNAQSDWLCDCGKSVNAKKSRCSSCQRWRGGNRKGSIGDNRIVFVPNTNDWACDKCGHSNAYNKVRCVACSRWKDGKRPNMKSNAPILAWNLAHPDEATLAAAGKWVCHNCEAINHKSRCRVCQSWKGARRYNLPKRNDPLPTSDHPAIPWTCNRCRYLNENTKSRCSSCQHWKNGKRLNIQAKGGNEPASLPNESCALHPAAANGHSLVYNHHNAWQCGKCSCVNEPSKFRCKSCQSWKNCKEQYQFQQAMAAFVDASEPTTEPTTTDPTKQWVCDGCNHSNVTNSMQCEACQRTRSSNISQKNHINVNMNNTQTFHSQNDSSVADSSAHAPQTIHATSQESQTSTKTIQAPHQQLVPWICPGCNKENLGSKARCGGCQKWKGKSCVQPTSS